MSLESLSPKPLKRQPGIEPSFLLLDSTTQVKKIHSLVE